MIGRISIMRHCDELKKLHDKWSADVVPQIKKIPNQVERLRLLIEAEKVELSSEIAQGIALYHESQ
jgi:hypothetical protein